jgi:predicted transcriptional regulator
LPRRRRASIDAESARRLRSVSYHLCYRNGVAQRHKRSISLPPDLDDAIEHAATATGTTVSAWLAETAAHRLKLDAGRNAIAAWENDHGALTPDELAEGLERARKLLGRHSRPTTKRKSA